MPKPKPGTPSIMAAHYSCPCAKERSAYEEIHDYEVSSKSQLKFSAQAADSYLMDTTDFPQIDGHVRVTFKDEDQDEHTGEPIGPVTVSELKQADDGANPFGPPAKAHHDLGWRGFAQARQIAAHYGVELIQT